MCLIYEIRFYGCRRVHPPPSLSLSFCPRYLAQDYAPACLGALYPTPRVCVGVGGGGDGGGEGLSGLEGSADGVRGDVDLLALLQAEEGAALDTSAGAAKLFGPPPATAAAAAAKGAAPPPCGWEHAAALGRALDAASTAQDHGGGGLLLSGERSSEHGAIAHEPPGRGALFLANFAGLLLVACLVRRCGGAKQRRGGRQAGSHRFDLI